MICTKFFLFTAEFVPFEFVSLHVSTLMCSTFCEGFEHHLVLTGEGWGLTVPGFLILLLPYFILFSLFLFTVSNYFFLKVLINILENTNAGGLSK